MDTLLLSKAMGFRRVTALRADDSFDPHCRGGGRLRGEHIAEICEYAPRERAHRVCDLDMHAYYDTRRRVRAR